MTDNDFANNFPKFIQTGKEQDSHVFDVDTQPNIIGVGSQLKVNVTASKDGANDLTAESSQSGELDPTTIIDAQDEPNNGDDDDETEPSDGNFRLDTPFNGLDRMIIDARFALGEESAILVLSGTGTQGETVQLEDNTNPGTWRDVAVVDENGFWKTNDTDPEGAFYEAATVTVNRSYDLSGDWYKVRVRYQSDPTGVLESENTFLPGFVFMSISQSERAQMFSSAKDNWPVDAFPIENNHNFQLLQHKGTQKTSWVDGVDPDHPDFEILPDGGVTGPIRNSPAVFPDDNGFLHFAAIPERYRISSEDPDDLGLRINRDSSTKFSTTLKHMANMFNETMPNIPVLFVDSQWSGSSRKTLLKPRTEFFRNNNGVIQNKVVRDFKFTQTCVHWCRHHGTEIGVVDDMWYASDSGMWRFDCAFSPLYTNVVIEFPGALEGVPNDADFPDGINVVGVTSDYTHGEPYPPGANNNTQEDFVCWASFFDASTDVKPHELGVGILRKDRTRWALMSTNRFSSPEDKSSIHGLWGSWFSNTEVVNAKNPQLTYKNAEQRYGINGGERDRDEDGNLLPTASAGSIDFDVLQGRPRGQSLPRIRRCVFNLVNQEHNYFMLPSFDPTVVCHGEMGTDSDDDGLNDVWSDDPHPCGNAVERFAFPASGNDVEYDLNHPDADIVYDFERALDGTIKMNEYLVLSAARTAGEVNIPIPVFQLDTISPTEAVFRVKNFGDLMSGGNGDNLPTGSKVETLFTVRGEPDLTDTSWLRDTDAQLGEGNGLEHPNYKKIIGFELNTGTGFSYEGFETDFGADGLSVKVIPTVPFKNGDIIRFNGGGCDSVHLWQSDCMHRIYRGMAILSIPGISAEGIPISAEPRSPIVTVSGL